MKDTQFKLWRWAPATVSAVLMIVIVFISVRTVSELKKATYRREHTFQVLLDTQALEDSLVNAQGSERGYLQTGQPRLLVEYKTETNAEIEELSQLDELTKNDPEQQARLKELAAAIKAVFAHDDQVIGVYARQGTPTASKSEQDAESWKVTDRAIHDLEDFSNEEKNLLAKQDATEQADYHKAARWLVAASLIAAVLLIFANYVAGREVARRRQSEVKQLDLIAALQKALAEVKTLSGLIPICSWCKSVRSDTDYWQSVEEYVRSRTDATFTHGLCPKCAEKMEAEIANAGNASGASPQA
jgi:CHASE3 domain sensor protein